MSAEDAKAILIEAVREEAEHDAVKIARAIERSAREDAQDKARDIVVTAIQRVAADHTAEHTVSVVHLPSDEMKGRIIGREGRNIRALEQATGIDLIIDDTPETVILSGFDPVRREVARLAITKLIADGRIHPGRIEEVVAKARAEVDTIMRQAGEQAAYEAGVPGLPADIVKTLGRLKFRTSYGQNVLNHVVETSHLAAIIAAEIGADVQVAKMGGLLHDIGKAVDHEVEGPHAAIGASIAQRHNLSPKVVNAIAAHHQEVEYTCLEAPIVQIADAISASRPGARGESMDTYVKRLEDLQAIAESFTGVERSFAVQAGREVRILVRPEEIDDLTASPARPRHRQEDRGAADLPGPDQGHGHPRDARRGVREVVTPRPGRRLESAPRPRHAAEQAQGRTHAQAHHDRAGCRDRCRHRPPARAAAASPGRPGNSRRSRRRCRPSRASFRRPTRRSTRSSSSRTAPTVGRPTATRSPAATRRPRRAG